MSLKLGIGIFLGTIGAGAIGYQAFNYVFDSHIIIVEKPTKPTNIGTIACDNPTHQAKIKNDTTVVYYICPQTSTPNTGATIFTTTTTGSTFSTTTPTSTNNQPTTWTYAQNGKTPAITIYWAAPEADKTLHTFFIHTNTTPNSEMELKTNKDIETVIKDIEQLRVMASIKLEEDSSTPKTINSISCTISKKATIPSFPKTEYYACTNISGAETTDTTTSPVKKISNTFSQELTLQNQTGETHLATKWTKGDNKQPIFYWFELKGTPSETDKETFFLSHTPSTAMTDAAIRQLIMEIENFKKE